MKVLKFLDKYFEEIICVVALAAMTVVIFIQIILRTISPLIQLPMAWTEEIGRYLFIYAVYVGAAYATKRMAHQKVDVLPLLVNDTGKLIFNLISDVGLIVFAAVMAIFGWKVVEQVAFIFVQNAPATKLNMGWAYAGPALGMTCCAVRAFQNIFRHISEYREKKKASAAVQEEGAA
ncbi:MAG: TRAP transporter small permease [Lachnospiraceae bacterium]|nr:TRAP transporter small permease [Lachnospiraceae bacterium]